MEKCALASPLLWSHADHCSRRLHSGSWIHISHTSISNHSTSSSILSTFNDVVKRSEKADLDVILFTNLSPSRQSYSSTRLRRTTTVVSSAYTLPYWSIHASHIAGQPSSRAITAPHSKRPHTTLPHTHHRHDVSFSFTSSAGTATLPSSSWTASDSSVDRHLAWLCYIPTITIATTTATSTRSRPQFGTCGLDISKSPRSYPRTDPSYTTSRPWRTSLDAIPR